MVTDKTHRPSGAFSLQMHLIQGTEGKVQLSARASTPAWVSRVVQSSSCACSGVANNLWQRSGYSSCQVLGPAHSVSWQQAMLRAGRSGGLA